MAEKGNKDTRDAILEAAYKVFGSAGFEGCSMKHIAREAGIVPGSIYNYFTDKEALFSSVVTEGWAFFTGEMQRIGDSPASLNEKFDTIIDVGFDLLKRAQPLLKGMLFAANQRSLVQENIACLLESWDRIFTEQNQGQAAVFFSRAERRVLVKFIVYGVLLAVALAAPAEIDAELARIKVEIQMIVKR